tara:strand:- start:168 stop:833 length:666 start_codon:yes stop_codon:yes gene_type:complete
MFYLLNKKITSNLFILIFMFFGISFLNTGVNADFGDSYFTERWAEIEGEKIDIREETLSILRNIRNQNEYDYLKKAYDILLEKGKESEVIWYTTKALDINNSFIALFMRAYAYESINENNKALSDLLKAIKLNQRSPEAYNNIGVTYANLKNDKTAIKYFEKAIRLNPKLAVAYHNVGVSQLTLGRKSTACSDFKKAAYLGRKFNLEWLETDAGKWCRQLR